MTDRVAGFIVTLERDLREDDARVTAEAIRQFRGVLSVAPLLADPLLSIATERARSELTAKLFRVVQPDDPQGR